MPLIVGLSGLVLTAEERAFLDDAAPLGIILFARNVANPEQVAALVQDCRDILGPHCWVLIDQEGGRVARLGPPHWPKRPAAARLAALPAPDDEECVYLSSRLIAGDLAELGINVDCLPVLDVPAEDSHPIIGDRAYGDDPEAIARLGRAACHGLLDGGVLPVIKHIPGHGRARSDSHLELPVVTASREDLQADFAPFAALSDAPIAMSAHVVYTSIDADLPATLSPKVINEVIRGSIGFEGVLLTDDLNMKALAGPLGERARQALAAGCDIVLHCSGVIAEMRDVAAACPSMPAATAERVKAATLKLHPPKPFDYGAAMARLEQHLPAMST